MSVLAAPGSGLCSMCQHGTTQTKTCRGCGAIFCRHLWRFVGHCTNDVCMACHRNYCTEGGETSPGHVFVPPVLPA